MKFRKTRVISTVLSTFAITASVLAADEDRIQALERQMAEANAEIAALKGQKTDLAPTAATAGKLQFGGYGEIHANYVDGGDDFLDIHRLVMFIGYDFSDWIKLTSEIELEHASTDEEYLLVEQLYADFLFFDAFNIRAGRILAPLGIINQHHEPTLFFGVERPNVDKYIIPSTWMLDGIGIFGYPLNWLSYEMYAVAGLDHSGFNAEEGIRGGRMKGRPGLNDPAVSGRVDFFPIATEKQDLRIGVSGYYGGTNNKNKGGSSTTDVDNTFAMVSADFEYDISRFQFRGVAAKGVNTDAEDLATGVGEQIFGWYLEGGISVLSESWKSGKLAEADVIPFVRYEKYDTQYNVPSGVAKDGNNDRTDITVGVNVPLTQQFVLKADYQFLYDEEGSNPDNKINLGMGWVFQ